MGYIRRPSWYKDFHCIAGACTDSCCCGWEIDIDEETFEFYNSVEGEFGERLRSKIAPANPENGEPAHFIQGKDERCPFLNERNLCDILLNVGEEHLSYICTHHPRFYEWYLDGREAGLGICCEEAARIMFRQKGRPVFECLKEDKENTEETEADEAVRNIEGTGADEAARGIEEAVADEAARGIEGTGADEAARGIEGTEANETARNIEETEDTENGFSDRADFCGDEVVDDGDFDFYAPEEEEREIEEFLFELREELFDIINDHEKYPALSDVMNALDLAAVHMQVKFDDFLYPAAEAEIWNDMDSVFAMPVFSKAFFTAKQVADVCTFLKGLEINDMSWWGLLERLRKKADEVLQAREAFDRFYGERQEEYRQLLNYFVYRYFMKAQDGDLSGRIGYAIMSVSTIYLLGVMQWLQDGELPEKAQIDLCKLYSKEIEYDEENTQSFADYYCQIREI